MLIEQSRTQAVVVSGKNWDKKEYIGMWGGLESSANAKVKNLTTMNPDEIKAKLQTRNIFHVANRSRGTISMFLSARSIAPAKDILVEGLLPPPEKNINGAKVCVKSEHKPILPLVTKLIEEALQSS